MSFRIPRCAGRGDPSLSGVCIWAPLLPWGPCFPSAPVPPSQETSLSSHVQFLAGNPEHRLACPLPTLLPWTGVRCSVLSKRR